jgi:hypothetical protein
VTQLDLDTLEPVRTFEGSVGFVRQLIGSADGTIIAVLGADRRVTLHDVATGVRLGTPIPLDPEADTWIDLARSGRYLGVGGGVPQPGFAVWDLDPERWVAGACRVAGRNLTREEWDANLRDLSPYRTSC